MSTWNHDAANDNTQALIAAFKDLDVEQRAALANHLLGGLSGYVDRDDFAQSLAAARRDAVRHDKAAPPRPPR